MSDQQPTEATQEAPQEQPEQKPEEQPKPTETVDFWKAKAREQEKRAKDNAAAATRLAEIEESQKSETQKLTDRATSAEERANKAESELARFQVALDKGLTPSQAKRLVGNTREELEADADELLKDIGDTSKPRPPRPDLNQGRTPASVPLDPRAADLAQIEADIAAAKRR